MEAGDVQISGAVPSTSAVRPMPDRDINLLVVTS